MKEKISWYGEKMLPTNMKETVEKIMPRRLNYEIHLQPSKKSASNMAMLPLPPDAHVSGFGASNFSALTSTAVIVIFAYTASRDAPIDYGSTLSYDIWYQLLYEILYHMCAADYMYSSESPSLPGRNDESPSVFPEGSPYRSTRGISGRDSWQRNSRLPKKYGLRSRPEAHNAES